MPAAPSQNFQDEIVKPVTRVTRRVEIYQADATSLYLGSSDLGLISGSVSVDMGRAERRTMDLVLDNSDYQIAHSWRETDLWYDKIIKAYRGVQLVDGSAWEAQIGEFMIEDISEPHFPHTLTIKTRDYTKKVLQTKLPAATSFAAGTAPEAVIGILATNAGITKLALAVTGKVLASVLTLSAGADRWKSCADVANAYGQELFFSSDGYLTTRAFRDPTTTPASYTFKTGMEGNLASFEKRSNDVNLYNHIVVRGETSNSIPVWAESRNDDPTSPTRIARLGERTFEFVSRVLTSSAECQTLADSFLAVYGLESYEVNLGSLVVPWLEAGDVMTFLDPNPSFAAPSAYLMSSFTIPMDLSPMSVVGKRLVIAGT